MNNTVEGLGPWVLVTGGSRGIGRALVREFAARGDRVAFTFRSAEAEARSIESEVAASGGQAFGYQIDGTDSDAVTAFADRLLAEQGAPRAVINNAGITRDGKFLSADQKSWRDVIANNIDAMFYITRAFIPAMVEQGGGVVLQMSSITAIKGNPGQTNYGASKAAMIGFTRSLAVELARLNIRVNALLTGLIATDMVDEMPEAARK